MTLEIYRAAAAGEGVGFVRHVPAPEMFAVVPWAKVLELFAERDAPWWRRALRVGPIRLEASSGDVWPLARRVARRFAGVLPEKVRRPLVLAAVMQAEAAGHAALFGAGVGVDGMRRVARVSVRRARSVVRIAARRLGKSKLDLGRAEPGNGLRALARPGDTLLVLGSPWFRREYGALARWLRDELRVGFGVLMCDLVPVRHPEWCDDGVRQSFRAWYSSVLPFCDLVLAISRHTAADVEAYAGELGIVLPRPVRVIPIGTGFPGMAAAPVAPAEEGAPYVLFVSTVEARKNHALAVDVWRRLLDEERAGTRTAGSVPDLVFAGRVGWLVADLMQELENSGWLGGRVRMVQAPSDSELQALYDGCLFTFFPSLHEGWGLPVTESLARGAPCVCSNAASLPEAGGALCRYFDPESARSARDMVAAVLDDPARLAVWRAQVRREFRPVPWADSAAAVLDEARAAAG